MVKYIFLIMHRLHQMKIIDKNKDYKHGSNEEARGQVSITPDDFALIPFVLNEFDKVEHDLTDSKGNKKLLFQKRCEGMVYIVTVERGENKIELRTFWNIRIPGASC